MKYLGIDSARNFRVVCQSLESHRFIEAVTFGLAFEPIFLATDRGSAAIRDCLLEVVTPRSVSSSRDASSLRR